MKVFFSPDVIPSRCLGSKRQITNLCLLVDTDVKSWRRHSTTPRLTTCGGLGRTPWPTKRSTLLRALVLSSWSTCRRLVGEWHSKSQREGGREKGKERERERERTHTHIHTHTHSHCTSRQKKPKIMLIEWSEIPEVESLPPPPSPLPTHITPPPLSLSLSVPSCGNKKKNTDVLFFVVSLHNHLNHRTEPSHRLVR